ncbi:MAG: hypothetical protein GEU94_16035 [Micromonosporaceae bacterium]|nr:hypothetical protein [Micromonosporaceae bacterium]
MSAFYCEVTWFRCGEGGYGGGACGNCHSDRFQHAWPNASYNCWLITRPDICGRSVSRRGCGFAHKTTSRCHGRSVTTRIADCGPRTRSFCGERACCNGRCARDRMMDLTRAPFSRLHSLSIGKFPGRISLP